MPGCIAWSTAPGSEESDRVFSGRSLVRLALEEGVASVACLSFEARRYLPKSVEVSENTYVEHCVLGVGIFTASSVLAMCWLILVRDRNGMKWSTSPIRHPSCFARGTCSYMVNSIDADGWCFGMAGILMFEPGVLPPLGRTIPNIPIGIPTRFPSRYVVV